MRKALVLIFLLTACGGTSRERIAADTCMQEVESRLAGKRFEADVKRLAASATSISADTLQLSAPIIFDRGSAEEYTQTIECRVRLDAASPSLLFLQFNWNIDDVKKAQ